MTHSYVCHDSFICVAWRIHMRNSATDLVHMCDVTHLRVWHDSFIYRSVTWLIHVRDMSHAYVWNDTFIFVVELVRMRDMTHSYFKVWHTSYLRDACFVTVRFIGQFLQKSPTISGSFAKMTCNLRHPIGLRHPVSVRRLIHMCDVTHWYVRHDLFICVTWSLHVRHAWFMSFLSHICVTWHIDMYDTTYWYVRHDSFICATWLIHTWDMTHSYAQRDSFICATRLMYMCDMKSPCAPCFIHVIPVTHMCDVTHWYVRHDLFIQGGECTSYAYRVAKTHRIPYLYRSFSAKATYI